MRQHMTERECSSDALDAADKARALTYDETKAAEAAFRGEPFNPAWSAAAAQVYAGISAAMAKKEMAALPHAAVESEAEYIQC